MTAIGPNGPEPATADATGHSHRYDLPRVSFLVRVMYYTRKIRKDKRKWCGVVTSRRALDAALVLDNPATRGAHSLYERDPMPACSHVAQSVCPQVHYDMHTRTATSACGCAQLLQGGDHIQRQSWTRPTSTGHSSCNVRQVSSSHITAIAAVGSHTSGPAASCCANIVPSMLPPPCLASHAYPPLAASGCAGAAPLGCAFYGTPRNPNARPPHSAALACVVCVCVGGEM